MMWYFFSYSLKSDFLTVFGITLHIKCNYGLYCSYHTNSAEHSGINRARQFPLFPLFKRTAHLLGHLPNAHRHFPFERSRERGMKRKMSQDWGVSAWTSVECNCTVVIIERAYRRNQKAKNECLSNYKF